MHKLRNNPNYLWIAKHRIAVATTVSLLVLLLLPVNFIHAVPYGKCDYCCYMATGQPLQVAQTDESESCLSKYPTDSHGNLLTLEYKTGPFILALYNYIFHRYAGYSPMLGIGRFFVSTSNIFFVAPVSLDNFLNRIRVDIIYPYIFYPVISWLFIFELFDKKWVIKQRFSKA